MNQSTKDDKGAKGRCGFGMHFAKELGRMTFGRTRVSRSNDIINSLNEVCWHERCERLCETLKLQTSVMLRLVIRGPSRLRQKARSLFEYIYA